MTRIFLPIIWIVVTGLAWPAFGWWAIGIGWLVGIMVAIISGIIQGRWS